MQNSQAIKCQNCKQNFTIAPEDFKFYEKILVPPPTLCPECRMQRRFAFRNERTLYNRKCDKCQKNNIAIYPLETVFPVYCMSCWWADDWDAAQYSGEPDFSKPFLEQFYKLQKRAPRPSMANYSESRSVNSPYTNCAGDLKNCYLVFGSLNDENCAYCHYTNDSRDSIDCLYVTRSEHCYECFDVERSYNLLYSQSCVGCRDSYFLFDSKNCSDCIGCAGLRNKSYYIFNKPYTKEEYRKKKNEMGLDSYKGVKALGGTYFKEIYFSSPRKYYHGQTNNAFSGDYVSNAEKTYDAFYTKNTRNVKHSFWCINAQDTQDYSGWGDVELLYEAVACGDKSYNCKFIHTSWSNIRNVEYSNLCFSSSYLFGCIGLRSKKYCILNKQYSQDEYEVMREKIIISMNELPYKDERGRIYRYGEFFPVEFSPFSYNETMAQEWFPFIKEEAKKQGYNWKNREKRDVIITMKTEELPDHIKDIPDSIIGEVIQCAHAAFTTSEVVNLTDPPAGGCSEQCTEAFRIIPQELKFYRQMNVPLPRLCPNCRHYQRVKQRNPLRLWKRKCMCGGKTSYQPKTTHYSLLTTNYTNTTPHSHGDKPCPNEFETSYSPERKEIVYCEQCYLQEVV